MIEYVRIRLEAARQQSTNEQLRIIQDLYKVGEERGYHHTLVFSWINEVVLGNLNNLRRKLDE